VGKPDRTSFGTVFLLGIPDKTSPNLSDPILVTAGHVLDEIGGDTATLTLRKKGADSTYTAYDYPIKIRDNGKPLYIKHDHADVGPASERWTKKRLRDGR